MTCLKLFMHLKCNPGIFQVRNKNYGSEKQPITHFNYLVPKSITIHTTYFNIICVCETDISYINRVRSQLHVVLILEKTHYDIKT